MFLFRTLIKNKYSFGELPHFLGLKILHIDFVAMYKLNSSDMSTERAKISVIPSLSLFVHSAVTFVFADVQDGWGARRKALLPSCLCQE